MNIGHKIDGTLIRHKSKELSEMQYHCKLKYINHLLIRETGLKVQIVVDIFISEY